MRNGERIISKDMTGCFHCEGFALEHKYLDGKYYCVRCYPNMVDVFLADIALNALNAKEPKKPSERIKEIHGPLDHPSVTLSVYGEQISAIIQYLDEQQRRSDPYV